MKKNLIALLLAPIIMAPFFLLDGFVLVKFWKWFIEPTLHYSTPPLLIAIGVGITASLLTKQYVHDQRTVAQKFEWMVMFPVATLFIGYLVHLLASYKQ